MFVAILDLPLWITGPAVVGGLCVYALLGLLLVRRRVLPRLRVQSGDSEFIGAMVQAVMVFYGLAVALIAVNVWQTHSDVAKIVSQEATAVAALYRDVSSYPEPLRSQLQDQLRGYLDYVIHDAWPLQRKGQVPAGGVELMNRFQASLAVFEPASEGQRVLHAETLNAYNEMIQSRRLRLDSVGTHLPGILWFIIFAGALIGISSSFFFRVEDARVHAIQVVLLAAFIGLVIFMTFALDRPFCGDLGLGPEPYQLVYEHLMKP
jgi:nitrate reductase gamma subunit